MVIIGNRMKNKRQKCGRKTDGQKNLLPGFLKIEFKLNARLEIKNPRQEKYTKYRNNSKLICGAYAEPMFLLIFFKMRGRKQRR